MELAHWLVQHGLERPTAALWATVGVLSALLLLGVALVAVQELRAARMARRRRGATRQPLGSQR